MPDVAHVHPGSLKDATMPLIFELKNEFGGFVDYEWFTAKIKKCSRRPCDGHLVIEGRFPGDIGETTVDLSDSELVYDVDWVLVSKNKEGGMSRGGDAAAKRSASAAPPLSTAAPAAAPAAVPAAAPAAAPVAPDPRRHPQQHPRHKRQRNQRASPTGQAAK